MKKLSFTKWTVGLLAASVVILAGAALVVDRGSSGRFLRTRPARLVALEAQSQPDEANRPPEVIERRSEAAQAEKNREPRRERSEEAPRPRKRIEIPEELRNDPKAFFAWLLGLSDEDLLAVALDPDNEDFLKNRWGQGSAEDDEAVFDGARRLAMRLDNAIKLEAPPDVRHDPTRFCAWALALPESDFVLLVMKVSLFGELMRMMEQLGPGEREEWGKRLQARMDETQERREAARKK